MTALTHWWWVRHAPVPDVGGRIYGQSDVDCDCSDLLAFQRVASTLPWDGVWVTSPLRRTHQTLAALAQAAGRPCPDALEEPLFAEQCFGQWEGLDWSGMQALDPDAYALFWRDPVGNAPPSGESFTALMQRAAIAIARLTEAHPGRDVVCISHGGTIRAAVAHALKLSPERAMAVVVDNLSLTRLTHISEGFLGGGPAWRLEAVNVPCRRHP